MNSPYPFVSYARKSENPEENVVKMEYIKLEFDMDPGNTASNYPRHLIIFKDGCAEYCKIETLRMLKVPADKSKMMKMLLKLLSKLQLLLMMKMLLRLKMLFKLKMLFRLKMVLRLQLLLKFHIHCYVKKRSEKTKILDKHKVGVLHKTEN